MFWRKLLAEVALEQALERLAVTGLVAGHLVDGIVDGVQVVLLGQLGQLELTGGSAVLGVHDERVAGVQVAGEDGAGNERLGVALQVALERRGPLMRIVGGSPYELVGGVGQFQRYLAILKAVL